MNTLFSPPYLFAAGIYLIIAALILLLFFAILGHKRAVKLSAITMVLAISFLTLVVFMGDWKIPNCYDASGNLFSELPQCRFN